ncbi:hypothetical protein C7C46_27000 [Streptomyces tateyamensis]|uniref:Uncharacterized protein n=1 Tax=Streptomyces tateyamensis TaxID=565073 RepID=A0A2V4NZJ4_9ACTN|nr:hypothetical protein [Streptomyces tateyamensis]PYC71035.1 hypothetical protein C7C46_27000 [Streptomyces tateyamensis]
MTDHANTEHDLADRPVTRAVPHPEPLNPRGIVITCAACSASRDWLLIQVRTLVFVRCRCAHEWQAHDLGAGDFDGSYSGPETEWDSFEQMYRGLGFDGLLRGCYLG